MSAFGYYEKDDIVESVQRFAEYKRQTQPEISIAKIVEEIMEAVGYGLSNTVYNLENKHI